MTTHLVREAENENTKRRGERVIAVAESAAVTEQGVVGVFVTAFDGLLFGWRLRHDTLRAAVFGHGLSNNHRAGGLLLRRTDVRALVSAT